MAGCALLASGAMTQTSSDSDFNSFQNLQSRRINPIMLETRIRALRSPISQRPPPRFFLIRPCRVAHVRDRHRAVCVLIAFKHSDKRRADREPRSVQGGKRCSLAIGRSVARIHPSRLEVTAARTTGNLTVAVLPRQPDFDVVCFSRGEPEIAGRQHHHTVMQAELLQDFLGTGGHTLVLVFRHAGWTMLPLNFGKLVLAQHTAGGPSRPGLRPKARVWAVNVAHPLLQDFAGHQIGQGTSAVGISQ